MTGNDNVFAITHIGFVRKSNEDRYLIKRLADGSVLLTVADGLGGEVAGDYAAEHNVTKSKAYVEVMRTEAGRKLYEEADNGN